MELGPYGFMPVESAVLQKELDARSLQVIAGTIYDDLTGTAGRSALLKKTRDICSLLRRVQVSDDDIYLVIIDAVKESRNNTAGHSELAERLDTDEWKTMMVNIREISDYFRSLYFPFRINRGP